jgi:hypothetical protein
VSKLPTVDMQKKNSVVLLGPSPPQRPRSDIHPLSVHHQSSVVNDQEPNGISSIIPNLEPALPREQTFT